MTTEAEEELLLLSDQREAKARGLLRAYRLVQRLSDAGDVHLVGSVALGVVYQEDIDLLVLVDEVEAHSLESTIAELVAADFKLSRSWWLGSGVQRRLAFALHFTREEPWQLDLCFARRDAYQSLTPTEFVHQRRRSLNTKKRRAIVLEIKSSMARCGSANMVPSSRIYDYVLETRGPSVGGFEAWLESRQ